MAGDPLGVLGRGHGPVRLGQRDRRHAARVQDYQTMVQCFQAMDRLPVTKLVRVPWNEPGIVGKVLD
jgi:hypothetical protein